MVLRAISIVRSLRSRSTTFPRRYFSIDHSGASSSSKNLRAAIVGSGPAAFYCAESLYKNLDDQNIRLDLYESLPVPYGLIRFGVAPDHADLKKCITGFERVIDRVGLERFGFYGNVRVGTDVKMEELLRAYHFVVLAYGAESDRKLGVDGEDARNCVSARRFVNWYNGLPGSSARTPVDLQRHDTAVIFGHGNVALDVGRILLTPVDALARTDIAEHALDALSRSRIRRCILVGRRGPLQVAFTTAELRQLIQAPRIIAEIHREDFASIEPMLPKLERVRKRLTNLMFDTARKPPTKSDPYSKWELRFLRSPSRILTANDGGVEAAELSINRLESVDGGNFEHDRAVEVKEAAKERIDCGLVIYSIGYKSVNIQHGFLPFDSKRHVIKADPNGRVAIPNTNLYACGWCSRGPVGVLVSTQNHSKLVAETIRDDLAAGKLHLDDGVEKSGSLEIEAILKERKIPYVTWNDWTRIDRVEKERGEKVGKPREKIVNVEELLQVAKGKLERQRSMKMSSSSNNDGGESDISTTTSQSSSSTSKFKIVARQRGIDDFTYDKEGTWQGPFTFVQSADTQFGMIDEFVNSNKSNPSVEPEIQLSMKAIEAINRMSPLPRFMIVCGDLIDAMPGVSFRRDQIAAFKSTFAKLDPSIKLICVCGNHDVGDRPSTETIDEYRRDFGDDFFSFWVGGVKFVTLNSQYFMDDTLVKEYRQEQDRWLEQVLRRNEREKWKHLIGFQHVPPFVKTADEGPVSVMGHPTLTFNISKMDERRGLLTKLKQAGMRKLFCGHYHRNAGGFDGDFEVIVTSAIGLQLGDDTNGVRVVKVLESEVTHEYFPLESIPSKVDV